MGFPNNILSIFQRRLEEKAKETEGEIAKLEAEDPFSDPTRLDDNAASDTDAKEQVSHQRIEAIKMELSKRLEQIKSALGRIGRGSYGVCTNCGKPIEKERLEIMPTAELCIKCEKEKGK